MRVFEKPLLNRANRFWVIRSVRFWRSTEEFLRENQKRAKSSEIANNLMKQGISIGGKHKGSRVSSYLSAARSIFDNNRQEGGYGLVEWGNQKELGQSVSSGPH